MTLLGDVFCVCPVVPYHALGGDFAGSAADGLSSAPPPAAEPASPVAAEAAGAGAPPACEQKAAFCLCYFGLLQDFSLSQGTGVCRAGVSALPSSSPAEAELPPGFDLTLCNFDGQRPVCVWKTASANVCLCFWKAYIFPKASQHTNSPAVGKKTQFGSWCHCQDQPKVSCFFQQGCLCLHPSDKAAGPGWILPLPPAASRHVWGSCK